MILSLEVYYVYDIIIGSVLRLCYYHWMCITFMILSLEVYYIYDIITGSVLHLWYYNWKCITFMILSLEVYYVYAKVNVVLSWENISKLYL